MLQLTYKIIPVLKMMQYYSDATIQIINAREETIHCQRSRALLQKLKKP